MRGRGTFHEFWTLQWRPEFALQLIEASRWGQTLVDAATTRVIERWRCRLGEGVADGQAGLAEQANSWVSAGQNLPVSAEQISQVFGNSALGDMAAQLGMPSEQVAGHLANLLPQVIDGLTPGGQLPAAGGADLGDALAGLAAMFGRG